ncbi:hydroxyacylglutathione hydrolase [Angomonas deanei]|nr:hydroxyacylglutathione hydrolase [Angomonas deanei]|eukprot:EPY34955.1 hydroxyacylglutathione hydrolase [Angomonas deanei]
MSLSWIGPSLIVSSVSYVFYRNHGGAIPGGDGTPKPFPISTTVFVGFWLILYIGGLIPKSKLFPARFYEGNIFALLYWYGYCSEGIGYRYLMSVFHPHNPFLHSDFRSGVRVLYRDGSKGGSPFVYKQAPLATLYNPPANATRMSAAQFASTLGNSNDASAPTCRGGAYVDLTSIAQRGSRAEGGGDGLLVIPVPIFTDNYSYLLLHLDTRKVVAVDPADAEPVLRMIVRLQQYLGDGGEKLELSEILITHKHWDHVGGVGVFAYLSSLNTDTPIAPDVHAQQNRHLEEFKDFVSPTLKIIGSTLEPTKGINTPIPLESYQVLFDTETKVAKDNYLQIGGDRIGVSVFHLPGHTKGHVCYLVGDLSEAKGSGEDSFCALFTGDVLFSGGLGGLFELTTVRQLLHCYDAFHCGEEKKECGINYPSFWKSESGLCTKVPDDHIYIYTGHEYTETLLSQVDQLMANRLTQLDGPTVKIHPGVLASLKQYKEHLDKAITEVKFLRQCSDGLKHVHEKGAHTATKLPFSTMPTTLSLEKQINPLLTLSRDSLEGLLRKEEECAKDGMPFSKTEADSLIYTTANRRFSPVQ